MDNNLTASQNLDQNPQLLNTLSINVDQNHGGSFHSNRSTSRNKSFNSQRRGSSHSKSRLLMDPLERQQVDEEARQEYYQRLDELKHKEGITEEEVKKFEKEEIIKKSVDEVKKKAHELEEIRTHPQRYQQVKSKVKQCLKVQKKTEKQKRKQQSQQNGMTQTQGKQNQARTSVLQSPTAEFYNSGFDLSSINGTTNRGQGLNMDDLGMKLSMQSPLSQRSIQKLSKRDEEIKKAEEELEQLEKNRKQQPKKEPLMSERVKERQRSPEKNFMSPKSSQASRRSPQRNGTALNTRKDANQGKQQQNQQPPVITKQNSSSLQQQKKKGSSSKQNSKPPSTSAYAQVKEQQIMTLAKQKSNDKIVKEGASSQNTTSKSKPKTSQQKNRISNNQKGKINGNQEKKIEQVEEQQQQEQQNHLNGERTIQKEETALNHKIVVQSKQNKIAQTQSGFTDKKKKSIDSIEGGHIEIEEKKDEQICISGSIIFVESRKEALDKRRRSEQQVNARRSKDFQDREKRVSVGSEEIAPEPQQMKVRKHEQIAANTGFNGKNHQSKSTQMKEQMENILKEESKSNNGKVEEQEFKDGLDQQSEEHQLKQDKESEEGFGKLAECSINEMKEIQKKMSSSKFLNQDLAQKTAAIQEEFEQLMSEMLESRKDKDPDGFYTLMSQLYGKGPDDERHSSPTKRLITLKNSTFDNKKIMQDNITRTQEYGLVYNSSPGRGYIIEPHGGELDYKLAEKNPLKFYDQVFNQDITKHKVKQNKGNKQHKTGSVEREIEEETDQQLQQSSPRQEQESHSPELIFSDEDEERKSANTPAPSATNIDKEAKKLLKKVKVEITSKVTKRPYLKIMEKIKNKLSIMLKNKIGEEFGKQITLALKDKAIEKDLKVLLKQEKIQIHNEQNQPVYVKQITQVAHEEGHEEVVSPSSTTVVQSSNKKKLEKKISIEMDKVKKQKDTQLLSPQGKQQQEAISPEMKSKTHLSVKKKDFQEIENKVRDHIKVKQKHQI